MLAGIIEKYAAYLPVTITLKTIGVWTIAVNDLLEAVPGVIRQ